MPAAEKETEKETEKPAYQRAYSAEHKAERFDQIMEATDRLFREQGFHEITLTTIARALGWSRGNLYRYVQTKEEVFLALYRKKNAAYISALAEEFEGDLPVPATDFAQRWAIVTDRHHDFLRYQQILTSVIETNVSLEKLAEFKRGLLGENMVAMRLVQRQVPGATMEEAAGAYMALVYEATGLHGHLCGSPVQMRAMEDAGMPLPEGGFPEALTAFVETYLTGLRARIREARR